MADFFLIMTDRYIPNFLKYHRRKTGEVNIGSVALGGNNPIRLQSMTNTPTSDIKSTLGQIIRIANMGADYVRMTVPSKKDAEALPAIVEGVSKIAAPVPLIADIHFNPSLAMLSAEVLDKVRINPGNFIDKKRRNTIEYTVEQYAEEQAILREKLILLLNICRKNNTALRIGTNHGSLSDRILTRFGDTPEGMAESAMEFLRICQEENFSEVVVSMKASNTRIMVYATRLLVAKMNAENMDYPLHLGVTEAGEGEDGRIKSAIGIGALLADGIGDTIRVSLTENPEIEIPVAKKITNYVQLFEGHAKIREFGHYPVNPFEYHRRETNTVDTIGGSNTPVVVHRIQGEVTAGKMASLGWTISDKQGWSFTDTAPDYLWIDSWPSNLPDFPKNRILQNYDIDGKETIHVYSELSELKAASSTAQVRFLRVWADELNSFLINELKKYENLVLMLESKNSNAPSDLRSAIFRLINSKLSNPVILCRNYKLTNSEDLQLQASIDLGGLLIDGMGDGICLQDKAKLSDTTINSVAFGILQASRVRISKTEFISCPSCGRTLFDLQSTTSKIRERTSHLKGLKIGIMGCIVNGPGEMADADYGYVGTGPGRVTLYKEKNVVKKNIDESEAVEELIDLIKENGDWTDA